MNPIFPCPVERRKILDYVTAEIQRNTPLATLFKVTLERVRKLLKLDRLLIYQLEVDSNQELGISSLVKVANRITYEAKASAKVSSLLNLQLDGSEEQASRCWQKYSQGFTLVVNDLENHNFPQALTIVMRRLQVKAKVVSPVLVDGLWGLLIAHQCLHTREWHPAEVKYLEEIAQALSQAVGKYRSHNELKQQKEKLEKQVETQAQQIEDALVAARVASQSKHEFLGNISHELKTPLTRVIGLSGTLLHWSLNQGRTPLPVEKQQQYLKTIQDSGKHLLKLIEQILEVSEFQSGKHLLNAQKFSLIELCQEIIDSLQAQAQHLGLELILDCKLNFDFNSFYGDRHRLEEIILNLLDNAFKFTPAAGSVYLRVWQENRQIILEVEDTGIGIADEQVPLLFETFKPLENFRQKIHEGAGIGLALTRHLVELHGGNIEVESELGKGSIFRIYLPISQPVASGQINAPKCDRVNGNKIALVTKDESMAAKMCQLMNQAQYKVVWSIDTATAVSQIVHLDPHLIILDLDDLDAEIPDVADTLDAIDVIDADKIILLYSQIDDLEWQSLQKIGIRLRFCKSHNLSLILNTISAYSASCS